MATDNSPRLTRRRLLATGAAGAAGATALGALLARGDSDGDHRNVLLVVIDTLRADHVGAFGATTVRTPAIDALAAEGTRFTSVFPEAMPTMPMRRTIMTGRRIFPFNDWVPWAGVGGSPGWQPILPRERTVIDEFKAAGYSTSYVTDNPFLAWAEALGPFRRSVDRLVPLAGYAGKTKPRSTISDRDARRVLPAHMLDNEREVALMRDHLALNGGAAGLDVDESRTPAATVFGAAIDNLREVARSPSGGPARRPFLMVVDAFDPHEPWAIPRRYRALYGDPDVPFIGNIAYGPADRLSAEEIERLRATYRAAVSLIDAQLGRLLDELDSLGLADSTTVVLVSDHGIHLGERNWVGKSAWLLNPELIHVPLIVRHPGAEGGLASDWLATTVDVPTTLLSLAGLRPPRQFDGADLAPIVRGEEPAVSRDLAYGGYANDFFARDHEWALVSDNRMIGSQLYDLRRDPGERRDVSADNPAVVERMRRRLLARLDEPPRFYRPEEFEREPRVLPDRLL